MVIDCVRFKLHFSLREQIYDFESIWNQNYFMFFKKIIHNFVGSKNFNSHNLKTWHWIKILKINEQ